MIPGPLVPTCSYSHFEAYQKWTKPKPTEVERKAKIYEHQNVFCFCSFWVVPKIPTFETLKLKFKKFNAQIMDSFAFHVGKVPRDLPFSFKQKTLHTALGVKGCKLRVIKVIVHTLPEVRNQHDSQQDSPVKTTKRSVTTPKTPGPFLFCSKTKKT